MSETAPAATSASLYGRRVSALSGRPSAATDAACPVCAARSARPVFAVEGESALVVRCDVCGLGRFSPMVAAERVVHFYPEEYYGEPGVKFAAPVEWVVRAVGAHHIQFLSRGLRAGARVLDVGCGRGVLLGALADHGFEVHGVEMSAEAARGADPRARICIAPRLAEAGYPDAHFDEVIVWHVLEHLRDPRGTLAEIHRILRPDGRLVVAVPNFASAQARWTGAAWFHLDLPRHLYHFPLPALRRLLESQGFALRSEHHFSLRQNPFGWIQSLANAMPGLPRNGLYALLHQRAAAEPPPYDRRTRALLWVLFVASIPFALAASLLETLARSGATVHVMATRGPRAAPGGAARASSDPA